MPSLHAPGLPRHIDALVLRCLAKAPADRFQSMVELTAALEMALQQVPSDASVSPAQLHHLLPTTKMPLGGAPAPDAVVANAVRARPVAPTTLGTSAGQFGPTAVRRRRVGFWIAGGVVVVAAGSAITGIVTRSSEAIGVEPRPDPIVVQNGLPSGSGSGPRAADDAGPVAQFKLPQGVPDAAEQVAATASDAGTMARSTTVSEPAELQSAKDARGSHNPAVAAHAPTKNGESSAAPTHQQVSGEATAPKHRPELPKPPAMSPKPPRPVPSSANPVADKCSKTAFATVYNATSPPQAQVEEAVRVLNDCHKNNKVNDVDFDVTKRALVAKLGKS